MVAYQRLRPIGVALTEQPCKLRVFLHEALLVLAAADDEQREAVDPLAELCDEVLQGAVSRRLQEQPVDLFVERRELLDPMMPEGLHVRLQQLVQVIELAVGDPARREPCRVAFEQLPHEVQVVEGLARVPVNHEPPARLADQISLQLQAQQRLADGRAAHPQHLREVGLDHERSGDEPSSHDRGPQLFVGALGERRPVHDSTGDAVSVRIEYISGCLPSRTSVPGAICLRRAVATLTTPVTSWS